MTYDNGVPPTPGRYTTTPTYSGPSATKQSKPTTRASSASPPRRSRLKISNTTPQMLRRRSWSLRIASIASKQKQGRGVSDMTSKPRWWRGRFGGSSGSKASLLMNESWWLGCVRRESEQAWHNARCPWLRTGMRPTIPDKLLFQAVQLLLLLLLLLPLSISSHCYRK